MAESRFTVRLCDEIANENSLINYLHSIPKSRRAEHIRLLLTAGYSAIVNNTPLTPQPIAIPTPQVTQPVAQTAAPCHTEVTPEPQAAPVQQVDSIPQPSIPDHEEIEEDYDTADESECSMDATDPLAKMKAMMGG